MSNLKRLALFGKFARIGKNNNNVARVLPSSAALLLQQMLGIIVRDLVAGFKLYNYY